MTQQVTEIKPLLRGRIHRVAFYAYLAASTLLLYFARPGVPRLSFGVYLATLLNMYGISSVLHITDWQRPWLEARLQKVDHASIFLLIAGTYTPICLSCLPRTGWATAMLFSVWIIGIAGVIKCLVWSNPPKAFNVAFYFVCGLTIVPFLPHLYDFVTWWTMLLYALGGAMYLAGGVIYGTEYPDPWPKIFGFHEIFHTLTILANICFIIPMSHCIMA